MIDFHTHSSASDGALNPKELLERAAREGVTRFALTDHDTINGYLTVKDRVPEGLRLVSGVELSCQWARIGIHVVGLGFDPDAPSLRQHLQLLDAARLVRAARIGDRLESAGMTGALRGAQSVASGAQIGRPHFARWMVMAGHVDSEEAAFKRFLGRGKPGDISVLWPSLEATREVPRRLIQPKRKTIGLRVPDHPIPQALLHALNEPLMSATLIMPGDDYPMTDPCDIRHYLEHEVDLVIDGGFCGLEATSVVDLTGPTPVVLRAGVGDVSDFEIA